MSDARGANSAPSDARGANSAPSDARGANLPLPRPRQAGSLHDAIADVYVQVRAPTWAAPNADGLVDVLRDLSWMPAGPVTIRVPLRFALGGSDLSHLIKVLMTAEADTAHGPHPVRVSVG
jgi:hypothetical protein